MNNIQINPQDLPAHDRIQLEKLNQLIEIFSDILKKSGFTGELGDNPLQKQVRFQRQLGLKNGLLDISVQISTDSDIPWHTAVIEFRSIGNTTPITINNMPIKQVIVQTSSSENQKVQFANYRQFSMQIYLQKPISYQHEDFLYQMRIEPYPTPKIMLGVAWMKPEMQISANEAIEILVQISSYISPTQI